MTQGGIFMTASKQAYNMLKEKEAFRARAYNDSEGNATIGYGHLLHLGPVTAKDRLLVWTEKQAEQSMEDSVRYVEAALNRAIRVHLNMNQFDALVVFTFNIGGGVLDEKKCSWLRELNKGYFEYVPALLSLYNKQDDGKGGHVVVPGLTARRTEEGKLFARPMAAPQATMPPDEAIISKKTQFPSSWR